MSNFGLPYMGSKSKIAELVCSLFPKAENFYDLFGGGFSITHCMLEKRKNDFKFFHYNEIRKGLPQIIQDCINGKYNDKVYKMPWISREDFFKRKDDDYFINIIWSFGNRGDSYIFGEKIEDNKRSLHQAIVFNEFDDFAKEIFGFDKFRDGYSIYDKRIFLKRRLEHLGKNRTGLQQLERLEQLEQLERLEQLQQLEQLERLERLQQLSFYNGDYRDVPIKENSVVYCDIPYRSTEKYDNNNRFNHKDFFDWARKLNHPLFVSEYDINQDFLKLCFIENVRSTLSSTSNSTKKVEKVYCNQIAWGLLQRGKKWLNEDQNQFK